MTTIPVLLASGAAVAIIAAAIQLTATTRRTRPRPDPKLVGRVNAMALELAQLRADLDAHEARLHEARHTIRRAPAGPGPVADLGAFSAARFTQPKAVG